MEDGAGGGGGGGEYLLTKFLHLMSYKRHTKRKKENVSRFGLAVRRWAGKQKGLGSIAFRLSFLFKEVVVCGHCLVTLSLTINETLKWLSCRLPI